MVLIVTDYDDISSRMVSYYIDRAGVKHKFLYPEDFEDLFSFSMLQDEINYFSGIWLRRGVHFINDKTGNNPFSSQGDVLNEYLHYLFESSPNCIGSLHAEYNHNKLIDLQMAESCGLLIPRTQIVSHKSHLIELLRSDSEKNYITKSFKNSYKIREDNLIYYYGYTLRVDDDMLDSLPSEFYPSLVQEEVQKKYEVRVFYLKSRMYAMAIFSQKNQKTQLDYRYYDKEYSNRNVPYQLSTELQIKIDNFMQHRKLNCGSIDLIYGEDGAYYFLEVNPVGQFGWLSSSCNYYLERELAFVLTNMSNV